VPAPDKGPDGPQQGQATGLAGMAICSYCRQPAEQAYHEQCWSKHQAEQAELEDKIQREAWQAMAARSNTGERRKGWDSVVRVTIGSMFSGVGGLELGLERGLRAGGFEARTVWQSEIDPTCCAILRRHWPDAELLGDVRGLTPPPADLICGGFPCQDISLAGSGAGLEGTRSGLWYEYAGIVGLVRPRVVVVENVSALVNRGLDRVLGTLAALGYDAWWDCLPAQAAGAPHRRDRLFVVAWRVSDSERHGLRDEPKRGAGAPQEANGWDSFPEYVGEALADAQRNGLQGEQQAGATSGPAVGGGDVADSNSRRREGQRQPWSPRRCGKQGARRDEPDGCDRPRWPPRPDDVLAWRSMPADTQPAICRVAYGIPRRVDRLRALGNAVVPQVAEVLGKAIARAMNTKKGMG
jgi:DNA (cytosine-5)-methyltransferase 1